MKVLGIDEAGRGSLVGPLLIGGFMIDDSLLPDLKSKGVTDSKKLTPKEREELNAWLRLKGTAMTIAISPEEIDMKSSVGFNLNRLEISKMIQVIKELKPDKVFIDCMSHNEGKIKSIFEGEVDCEVVCECKSDENYVIVGAGSIIAKTERDSRIRLIESELGAVIGAGYPSDERTIEFARKALSNPLWLKHVRHSWDTFSRIKGELEQTKLNF